MSLYLLNASIVWLVSLLAYEILFRRETVHHWNRAYLLGTLVLGFLLPLWSWNYPMSVSPSPTITEGAIVRTVHMKQVVATTVDAAPAANIPWVWILYGIGVAAFLGRLALDVTKLVGLYRKGTKTRYANYTLVETHGHHGPFSFFGFVFIADSKVYTAQQLEMVLHHELRHARLLHSIDTIALQLVRTVLWFHPLVHWYHKRLQLVHEYQADAAESTNAPQYGRFLIEQNLTGAVPSFAHSFYRSPLKNRITMLVSNPSSRARLLRYVLIAPMITLLALGCSKGNKTTSENSSTSDFNKKIFTKDGKLHFRDNEFEMSFPKKDTVYAHLTKTSDKLDTIVTTLDPSPIKMNGEKIYDSRELSSIAKYKGNYKNAAEHLFKAIQPKLEKLPDGKYGLDFGTSVIDKQGKLVYFETIGLINTSGTSFDVGDNNLLSPQKGNGIAPTPVNKTLKSEIRTAMENALSSQDIEFSPAIHNGKPVVSFLEGDMDFVFRNSIQVKNNKATLVRNL